MAGGSSPLPSCSAAFGWGLGLHMARRSTPDAVREARGWSLLLVSTAVTVHFLFGAIVVANLPRLYSRFGIPTVTKAVSCIVGGRHHWLGRSA